MKLVFTINPLVAALLASTIDRKKVEQACESYRNRMTIAKDDEGKNRESGERRLRVAGSKASGQRAEERTTYSCVRIGDLNGESNVVARFIAYNDEVTLLEKRLAKVEGAVKLVQIPLEFSKWLASTGFNPVGARTPRPARKSAPASNGKANGSTEKPAEVNRLAEVAK